MTDNKDIDIRQLIYTPQQSSSYALAAISQIRANKARGVPLGIEGIDGTFAPVMPGQICAVIAQTSHYKSGFLHFVEFNLAKRILVGDRSSEIVVHISVEEGVEEQENLEIARMTGFSAGKIMTGEVDDDEAINRAAMEIANLPIYRIGDSQARRDTDIPLHVTNMELAIRHLINDMLDWKPKIAAIFVDFLQKIPLDPSEVARTNTTEQRRLQVMSDVRRLRKMAQKFDCPLFLAVQAKQELKYAKPPVYIPSIYDGEESSAIAQYCDRVLTLWLPIRSCDRDEILKIEGREWRIKPNSLWLKIAKQRGGFDGVRTYPCLVDFIHNTIGIDPDMYSLSGARR